MTTEQAVGAHLAVEQVAGLSGAEQVVLGTIHFGAVPAGLGWPGSRLVVRSGPDGADLALLEVLIEERIGERFDEVVLVSGDGIFTEVVTALGAAGVEVTVVAHAGRCSKRLRMAAARSVVLAESATGFGGAA